MKFFFLFPYYSLLYKKLNFKRTNLLTELLESEKEKLFIVFKNQ